jgi:hypothetical protein
MLQRALQVAPLVPSKKMQIFVYTLLTPEAQLW